MMKRFYLFCLLGYLLFTLSATAGVRKSNLKVLYVGGSPNVSEMAQAHDSLIAEQSARQRMDLFEKMLKTYFKQVTVIQASEYIPQMSENYDVTIMDGKPKPIEPEIRKIGRNGELVEFRKAGYLPQDFSCPMLMIADMSACIGSRIGLKTDWYCLCLDADALRFRREHPIFNGPFPVKMTIVNKPTPELARNLPYPDGGAVPDSLPMWRVQKEGYSTSPNVRVGMVSRPGGFEDSPEAEMISGGVSAKTLDAVAIGRHGNFLHWGFAAAPDNMTEEAKTVFANAVVYIAGFAGQTPIARKYNDRIITRHEASLFAFAATRAYHEGNMKAAQERDKIILGMQKEAKEKQERGETLTSSEKMYLNYQPQPYPVYEEELQKQFPDLYPLFGNDERGYVDYFTDNAPYFIPKGRLYSFMIDEDVRSLGIPNNDVRLLDKAIGLWESGENASKGRRLLERYTLCRFASPGEWRRWYETNKSRLFFTESGGWIFMVDSRESAQPANDYSVRDPRLKSNIVTPTSASVDNLPQTEATDDRNPVRVAAVVNSLPNGNRQLVVRVKIHSGYHIYAHVAEGDPFIPVSLDFRLPAGVRKVGELQKPAAKAYNNKGTMVYEKEIVFRQEISGSGKVGCIFGWQCCNENICMPPAEINLNLE